MKPMIPITCIDSHKRCHVMQTAKAGQGIPPSAMFSPVIDANYQSCGAYGEATLTGSILFLDAASHRSRQNSCNDLEPVLELTVCNHTSYIMLVLAAQIDLDSRTCCSILHTFVLMGPECNPEACSISPSLSSGDLQLPDHLAAFCVHLS